jgi:hypothetical protein
MKLTKFGAVVVLLNALIAVTVTADDQKETKNEQGKEVVINIKGGEFVTN